MADGTRMQQFASLKNIPGLLGYQVLKTDGTVIVLYIRLLQSAGDLQNRDSFAGNVAKLVNVAGTDTLPEQYKRISVYFDDHFYVICRSGDTLMVVKRQLQTTSEPVVT